MMNVRTRTKKVARGQVTQLMTYPRQKTRAVLVEAAKASGRGSLSNFMVVAGLRAAAEILKKPLHELLPIDELARLAIPIPATALQPTEPAA